MRVIQARPRPTVRLRLTILYGALFFAAGVLLLAVNYTLLRESLAEDMGQSRRIVSTELAPNGATQTTTTFPDDDPAVGMGGGMQTELAEYQSALHEAAVLSVVQYRHDFRDAALNSMVVQSGFAIALTGVAALGLGWLVAGRVLRPIQEITRTARRASESNLHARVNLAGPRDELQELADTFDLMVSRLETSFESQRRFAADASHELRTPIAIIQAEADIVLAEPDVTERERRLAASVQAAAQRGERLIASLLALARSQSTLLDRHQLNLADLAGEVVGELLPKATTSGVRVDLELADVTVLGDRMLLERLVINLVENAIHHNVPNGWVAVSVGSVGDVALLHVANSGPGVASAEIATLFEPFARQVSGHASSPPGFGLGLAIVRSIVLSHGGAVTAVPRVAGGLNVTVELPAVPASSPCAAEVGPDTRFRMPSGSVA